MSLFAIVETQEMVDADQTKMDYGFSQMADSCLNCRGLKSEGQYYDDEGVVHDAPLCYYGNVFRFPV